MNTAYSRIYFVGIGGIGMSALAHYLNTQGIKIAGCDGSLEQKPIYALQEQNIAVHQEHACQNFLNEYKPDLVVYTNTAPDHHPAICYAREHAIACITRSKLLASSVNPMTTIGITGSHGKTSTTAMTASVFLACNSDPTIFVGGYMQSIGSNVRCGKSEYAVVEADDAYRSFLDLTPHTAIITTVGYEHLETYRDWNDIYATFTRYLQNTKPDGNIIINYDCQHARHCAQQSQRSHLSYGFDRSYDISAQSVDLQPHGSHFHVYEKGTHTGTIQMSIPGIHMASNALSAYAAARCYGLDPEAICKALSAYRGVERRFELRGSFGPCKVIDDYGHHPTEIDHVLRCARSQCTGKLIVFFQPHKYSRTKFLWNDFVRVLSSHNVDHLVITDIFSAGEAPMEQCSAELLAQATQQTGTTCSYIPFDSQYAHLLKTANEFKPELTEQDMIVCLGAGKLDGLAELLAR